MSEPSAGKATLHREQTRLIVLWGAALAFATKAGTIILSIILARMVSPEMYGQYGAVSTILLFVMSFSMQRFTENIFHETPSPADYHRHIAFGSLLHGLLFLIVNGIALGMTLDPTLARVAIYLHIGSFSILLNVPRILYSTHLRMTLQWKKIRLLSLVSFGLYAIVSIGLASLGHGVWALLAQNLIIPVPYVVAFLLDDRSLRGVNLDWPAYRKAFRFGLLRSGGAAISTGYGAVESLIFSLALDFGALGMFNRARGLSQLVTSWLSDQMGSILYPSMAGLASRSEASRRAAGLLLRVNLWSSGAVAIAVAAAPAASVYLLYGSQWSAVAPLIPPILLAAISGSMLTMCSLILLTNLGPRHSVSLDTAAVAVNALGLLIIVPGGVPAYSAYLGGANFLLIVAVLIYMVRMRLLDARDLARAMIPPVLAGVVVLTVATFPAFDQAESRWPIPILLATGATCATAVLALARLLDPRGLETILGLLPGGRMARRLLFLRDGSQA